MEAKKGSPKVHGDNSNPKQRGGLPNAAPSPQHTIIPPNAKERLLSQEADIEHGQLRQRHAIENPLAVANFKESILKRIFPPGKKATGIRRYMFSLVFLLVLDTLLWGIFAGVYSTSVKPVMELSQDTDMYQARSCLVVSQRMDHDVSLAYFSLWRSEITVQYNVTNLGSVQHAQIHDSVTGIYGRLSVAISFLDDFQVGRRFTCHVMTHNRYFAAVQGEKVLTPVIIGLVILGLGAIVVLWALFRLCVSFLRFKRDFVWDHARQVWLVRRSSS